MPHSKGKTMNVQELINELMLIEDKAKEVKTFDQDYGDWLDCAGAVDYGDFIGVQ